VFSFTKETSVGNGIATRLPSKLMCKENKFKMVEVELRLSD